MEWKCKRIYLNGKINKNGTKYYDNLKLEFEEDYLNRRNWNGKEKNIIIMEN